VLQKVMHPRRIVDSLGNLKEEREVVGSQIQETPRTAEVETPVFAELSGGVFPFVAAPLGLWSEDPEAIQ
jgi:hypothetical protein